MSQKKTKESSVFNPFEWRAPEKVWKEIRKNAQPTTREEALREMKSLKQKEKK
jgi:hypothetical protein